MHIDFALPVNHDLLAGFKQWQEKAKAACADYGFHMAVTSWGPKVAADMAALVKQGINSFKFFMAYKVTHTSIVRFQLHLHDTFIAQSTMELCGYAGHSECHACPNNSCLGC